MGAPVTRKTVIFSRPYRVELEQRPLPEIPRGSVLVQTRLSLQPASSSTGSAIAASRKRRRDENAGRRLERVIEGKKKCRRPVRCM